MLTNFLRIAFRNLFRRSGYTVLSLFGLAVGITCCLLIFEYVAYEKSYDTFHEKADQIVRVQLDEFQDKKLVVKCASICPAAGPALKKDFPEVENSCRLYAADFLLSNEDRNIKFEEKKVFYADTSLLSMFHIPLLSGNPATALLGVNQIILSEDMAHKYFGKENPMGKTLTSRGGGGATRFEVTGVFKNYPANAHLSFNLILSYKTLVQRIGGNDTTSEAETSWGWTDYYTYLQLKKGTDWRRVDAKLQAFADHYMNSRADMRSAKDSIAFRLMPLKNIHLYSHDTEEAEANGDGQAVAFLFLIAFFIVLIAWINYTNLATARSMERAREVGVRKVLGALRLDLIRQFLLESLLLNLMALGVALLAAWLLSPVFSRFTGRAIGNGLNLPFEYWRIFTGLFLFGTFLSGAYPALVLSRYQPVAVLKGRFKNTEGGQWIRKSLIVGQFAASIILIAGTIVVIMQVHFMRSQDSGAKIDQTVVLHGARSPDDSLRQKKVTAFKQDLLQISGVNSFTASSSVMGQEVLWCTNWKNMQDPNRGMTNLFHMAIDDDFIPSYGLRLAAGRNLSKDYPTDKKAALLNESAVRALGFASPAKALHEKISSGYGELEIVGVLADFHQEGLQNAITPLVFFSKPGNLNYYSVKTSSENMPQLIANAKKIWGSYFPEDPFNFFFLDEFYNRQYAENQRFGVVFALFAFLAITIACFGLLGLSAYNVLQRTKEIGIRKLLGATSSHLLYLLSRDFLVLVLIALVIAIPVTHFAMNNWLQGFAYRIQISWWIYAIAGFSAILIAMLTICFESLKAALANPVKSLKTE
ncbi:ABC transporter permease [Flavitalea flava]